MSEHPAFAEVGFQANVELQFGITHLQMAEESKPNLDRMMRQLQLPTNFNYPGFRLRSCGDLKAGSQIEARAGTTIMDVPE